MKSRLSPSDIALGICVALIWGMGMVFAKAAIAHFPPILLMALRFLVTALALVWFVRPPLGQIRRMALIAFVASALQYSLTFTGLKGLDASIAALVVQLEVPFLVIIGAVALNERPGWRKWLGIALAFAGVTQIAGTPQAISAWGSVLMVVAGALTWAIGQAMIRKLADIDGLTVTAWIAVLATPQLFIMSWLFERDQLHALQTAGPVVWATVAYLGLIMNALGYGIWNTLVRRNPISRIAPFLLLLPVFAIVGSIILLNEQLTTGALIGGAIVIFGVAIILTDPTSDSDNT